MTMEPETNQVTSSSENAPEHIPLSREEMLNATFRLGVFALIGTHFVDSKTGFISRHLGSKNKEKWEGRDSLKNLAPADVNRLIIPRTDSISYSLLFSPEAETLRVVPHSCFRVVTREGPLEKLPKGRSREEAIKHPDHAGQGSCFFIQIDGQSCMVTNHHTLRNVGDHIEQHCILDYDSDIGIAPIEYCQTKSDEKIHGGKLCSMSNSDLSGRKVNIYGLGARSFWDISGEALYVNRYGRNFSNCLLVKTGSRKSINNNEFQGMSGSPVIDCETGDIAGVVCAVTRIQGNNYIVFTGPDELKINIDRMRRMMI